MPTYTLHLANAYAIALTGGGGAPWSNVSNSLVVDGTSATESTITGSSGFVQVQDVISTPAFSVGEYLVQVDIHVVRSASLNAGNDHVQDGEIRIVIGTAANNTYNFADLVAYWPTSLTDKVYTITQSQIAAIGFSLANVGAGFGAAVRAVTTNLIFGSSTAITASIDGIYVVLTTQLPSAYTETPGVSLSLTASETDSQTSGGAHHYQDYPAASLTMAPAENDILSIPETTFNEFPKVSLGIFPSVLRGDGPFQYIEEPSVNLALTTAEVDVIKPYELVGASLGASAAESDVYQQAGNLRFPEFPNSFLYITASVTDHQTSSDSANVTIAFVEASSAPSSYHDQPAAALSPRPSEHDAWHTGGLAPVSLSQTPGGYDKDRFRDRAPAALSSTAGGTMIFRARDNTPVSLGFTPAQSDHSAYAMHAPVSLTQIPGGRDVGSWHDTAPAGYRFIPAAPDKAKQKDRSPAALSITAACQSGGVSHSTFAPVYFHWVPSAIDHNAYSDHVRASLTLSSVHKQPDIQSIGLIPSIRYHIATTLSLTQISEGMPSGTIGKDVTPPFACIIAQKPSERQGGVNQFLNDIVIDIVLVMKQVGGVDNPQAMRADLAPLAAALLADYKQTGRTGIPSALYTYVSATPFDRLSAYQKAFADAGEQITVQVLSVRCATQGLS